MRGWPALALALAAVLGGCAELSALRSVGTEEIERWVVEQEYEKALNGLGRVRPSQPDYVELQARRLEIERLADGFETRVLGEARSLARQKQWQAALERYDDGLAKLPSRERLLHARVALLEERARYVQGLRSQSALDRGEWLARELPRQRQIVQAIPEDGEARRQLKRVEANVEETGSELYLCGQQALERGDNRQAVQCLALAQQLTPTLAVARALVRAKAEQDKQRDLERRFKLKRRKQARVAKERVLLERYEAAFAERDLLEAREAIEALRALNSKSPKLDGLDQQLRAAIADTVEEGMEVSRRLYSQGRFEEALAGWRALLVLDPENEALKAHVARAERVLAKLRVLNEKQPGSASAESAAP